MSHPDLWLRLGERILFSDHDHWSHARLIAGYRSQSEIEGDFRQMKDPAVVGFSPMFHWTDQKIRVHTFYCVLALTIARLMRRQAARAGYPMSVRELLATLADIQETVLIYPSTGVYRIRQKLDAPGGMSEIELRNVRGVAGRLAGRGCKRLVEPEGVRHTGFVTGHCHPGSARSRPSSTSHW